jgi:hypothetical protein
MKKDHEEEMNEMKHNKHKGKHGKKESRGRS